MRYREFQVPTPLSKSVECIWLLEGSERQEKRIYQAGSNH